MTAPLAAPTTQESIAEPASGPTPAPLLPALNLDEALATAAWRSWRGAVDIQHLTWPEMQLLPVLNGPRLDGWLADDPAAGIIKGIVRRAWSEAQVRLGLAREIFGCLHRSGCAPLTLIGAAGAYLRCLDSTAVRPVLELRVLIPRWHLPLAAAVLEAEGWQPRDACPEGDWLDRRSHILYSRNGSRLYLHWRLLEVEPRLAAACEREFLAPRSAVQAIGTEFPILAPADALLESLSVHSESVDALAWQAEVALVLHSVGGSIDWPRFRRVATRFRPGLLDRFAELRALGLAVPEAAEIAPPASSVSRLLHRVLGRA
jgi:hypothetical protein